MLSNFDERRIKMSISKLSKVFGNTREEQKALIEEVIDFLVTITPYSVVKGKASY